MMQGFQPCIDGAHTLETSLRGGHGRASSAATLISLVNIPMDLFEKWAMESQGKRKIEKAVMDAEMVFLRAYFESDFAD